jgi:anti-sigma regulatory factor (Ser/Thr protein kinase)
MSARLHGEPLSGQGSKGRGTQRTEPELFLKLELKSNPEALCVVRAAVERAAEALHFSEADTRAIVRSVDEGLSNVMRHAYQGRTGLPIEVHCRRLDGKRIREGRGGIEIVLHDEGLAANPEKLKGRPLDEIRPGGLGLHFIRQSMDVVEFSRKKGKNQLRMVKYLSPTPAQTGPEGE